MTNGLITEDFTEMSMKLCGIIQENSKKVGTFAEDMILPRCQRNVHGTENNALVKERNVEKDISIWMDIMTDDGPSQMQQMKPKYMPWFMIGISVIQICLMYFLNRYSNNLPMLVFGYDPHRRYEFWRFLTMMFIHTSLSNLWTNVIIQLILGALLEIVHDWARIAVIYFASVIGGSLFITLLSPNNYVVGASAGVYGLLFSHLSTLILNWKDMDKKPFGLLISLLYLFANEYTNLQLVHEDQETNYVRDLGGGLTGFLVSILVLNFEPQQWKTKMQIICVAILTSLAIAIICGNIFAWQFYLPTEWNSNYRNSYVHFVYQRAITSPDGSGARIKCNLLTNCKILLNRFIAKSFNVTTTKSD